MNQNTSSLHLEIFDKQRLEIWKTLKIFKSVGVLGGGTALALQIGFRQSYDFDIFTKNKIDKSLLLEVISVFGKENIRTIIDQQSELTVQLYQQIQLTFFYHPFPPLHPTLTTNSLELFDIYDLASTKANTIGRRGTWRDYVDLYWLIAKENLNFDTIIEEAKNRFTGQFSEKLFYEQLVYWGDISDFAIEYIGGKVDDEVIKNYYKNLVKSRL